MGAAGRRRGGARLGAPQRSAAAQGLEILPRGDPTAMGSAVLGEGDAAAAEGTRLAARASESALIAPPMVAPPLPPRPRQKDGCLPGGVHAHAHGLALGRVRAR